MDTNLQDMSLHHINFFLQVLITHRIGWVLWETTTIKVFICLSITPPHRMELNIVMRRCTLFWWITSAPWDISSYTMSLWPFSAAHVMALNPYCRLSHLISSVPIVCGYLAIYMYHCSITTKDLGASAPNHMPFLFSNLP